jgi:hypothetical protein
MCLPFQQIPERTAASKKAGPGLGFRSDPRRLFNAPKLYLWAFLALIIAQSAWAVAAEPSSPLDPSVAISSAHSTGEHANFSGVIASIETRTVADWIVRSGDNQGLSFIVIDKANAELFLFDAGGSIRAATPVLLGLAIGDDSPPGIGTQKMSTMRKADQITPAGRFVAGRGLNLAGQDILWIDYAAAISLHRASDRKPGMTMRSRAERLASTTTSDNRASHGCVNVSVLFYDNFIRPAFEGTAGIVYVLPETRSARAEFNIPA